MPATKAENFSVAEGFHARAWGDNNYFCSDLNNVFLSRSAYLQGLANQTRASAAATVAVPARDSYAVLFRDANLKGGQGGRSRDSIAFLRTSH